MIDKHIYTERTILTYVYGSSRFFTVITKPGETAGDAHYRMFSNPTELIVNQHASETPADVRKKMINSSHFPQYDRVVRK